MKNLFTIIILISLAIILSVGCSDDKKDSNPTESNNEDAVDLSSLGGQPGPTSLTSGNYNGVMASVSYEVATIPGFPSVATTFAFASFANGVDAGTVSVNSNNLGKTVTSGSTSYLHPDPSNPLAQISNVSFNGSAHNWSVAGGNGIPSLSGSVNSPSSFTLNSPAANATVSKSAGFDVTWSTDGSGNAKILVVVTQTNNRNYFSVDELDDDGSYNLDSASLKNISGSCLLQVVKYTYSSLSSGGKDYYMISEIVKSITINVN